MICMTYTFSRLPALIVGAVLIGCDNEPAADPAPVPDGAASPSSRAVQ
jgi:hypothetical protein